MILSEFPALSLITIIRPDGSATMRVVKLELSMMLLLLLPLLPAGSETSNFSFPSGVDVTQQSIPQPVAANSRL